MRWHPVGRAEQSCCWLQRNPRDKGAVQSVCLLFERLCNVVVTKVGQEGMELFEAKFFKLEKRQSSNVKGKWIWGCLGSVCPAAPAGRGADKHPFWKLNSTPSAGWAAAPRSWLRIADRAHCCGLSPKAVRSAREAPAAPGRSGAHEQWDETEPFLGCWRAAGHT